MGTVLASGAYGDEMTRLLRPPLQHFGNRRIAFLTLVGLVMMLGLPSAALAATPVAQTSDVFSTGAATATVEGVVDPMGESTTYAVQWDVNSSTWCQSFADPAFTPANTTSATTLDFTDNVAHDVSSNLTGLTGGADYCAQLIATNGSGEGDGGTFEWMQPAELTVSRTGSGSGTVTSSPAGVNCGSTCSTSFDAGTPVTLTATAAAGSTFAGWSGGGCSGTGTCQVTLSTDATVTATFNTAPPVTHTLTVSLSGSPGSGMVTSSPVGINCGSTCSHAFTAGTQVTLTATSGSGSPFSGWSGGGCSGNSTCVVTLSADTTVTAIFFLSPPAPVPATKCIVPKLKGKTLAAAKRAIKSHHCSVGKVMKVTSSTKNKGHVVSQSPKPGKHLRKGSKVALKVGK